MSRIIRNSLITMAGTLASRSLGMVRQTVMNNLFSPLLTDAFNIAARVPNLFRELVAEGAVTNALIPVLKAQKPQEAKRLVDRFAALLLVVNLVLLGLGLLLAPWIARLLIDSSSEFNEPKKFALLVYQIRLVVPFLLAISMAALFSAVLQSDERFGVAAFAPIALNVVSIVIMLIWPQNATALALSYTLGAFVQAAVFLPSLKGLDLEFAPHPALRAVLVRMGPFAFTTSLRQFLNLVLTNLLTRFPLGAQTAFISAETIFQTALGLLAISPAMALYPRLTELGNAKNYAGMGNLLKRSLERLLLLLGLAGALMSGLAPWIVGAIFAWGGLDAAIRSFSTEIVLAFGLALLPWGTNQLMLRAFYAAGEIRRAVQVSALIFLLNTLGYWLLAQTERLFFLNLATAIAGYVGLLIYVRRLEALKILSTAWLLRFLSKVLLASIPACLAAYGAARWAFGFPTFALTNLPPLLLGGAVGSGVFLGLALLLRLPIRRGLLR